MRRQSINIYNWALPAALVLFFIIAVGLLLFRTQAGMFAFAWEDNYQQLNEITIFHQTGQGNFYTATLYVFSLIGSLSALPFISIFFGLISLLLFANVIKPFVRSRREYLFALGLFVCSAPLLGATQTLVPLFFYASLGLLALWLFQQHIFYQQQIQRPVIFTGYFLTGLLVLLLLFCYAPLLGLLGFIGLVLHELTVHNINNSLPVLCTFALALVITRWLPFSTSLLGPGFSSTIHMNDIFSFFGGVFGFTLFLFVLGAGAFLLYKRISLPSTKLLFASLLVLSFFDLYVRFFAIILLIYYAAVGFEYLLTFKWDVALLHYLTVVLFISILFFSTLTFVTDYIDSFPLKEDIRAAQSLGDLGEQQAASNQQFLAPVAKAEMFTYFSGKNAFASQQRDMRIVAALNLYKSQSYSETLDFLDAHNISFIVFDRSFFEPKSEPEGLYLIATSSEQFTKKYDSKNYEIYFYSPPLSQ